MLVSMWGNWNCCTRVDGNVKRFSCCGKHFEVFKIIKEVKLSYDPAISLRVYPKELKSLMLKCICSPIFIEALSTMAHYGNNLNIHQWMNG